MTIRIIGGTPRSGKSTLLRFLSATALDLDHLRWSLSKTMALDEELESPSRLPRGDTSDWMRLMDEREDAVWTVAGRYAAAAGYASEDALICGVIRPDHLDDPILDGYDVRAVFLVDTGITKRIDDIVRAAAPDNWLRGWSHDDARHWASLNEERSRRIAARPNARVFDVDVLGYDECICRARAALNV